MFYSPEHMKVDVYGLKKENHTILNICVFRIGPIFIGYAYKYIWWWQTWFYTCYASR